MKAARQTVEPLEHLTLHASNRFADFYVRNVERGQMLLDAPYQRGSVWTEDQQVALVRSWTMGLPIPAVIINDRTTGAWLDANPQDRHGAGVGYAVIDGKQRILTAVAWLRGALAVPASWFPPNHIGSTEPTDDGPYVRYTSLTNVGQRFAENRCVLACAEGQLATVEQEAEVYLLLNGGGTPQTGADMDNARRAAGS
jgi:hypothetical protein